MRVRSLSHLRMVSTGRRTLVNPLRRLTDWKSVGSGVCELRIDHGPGYRVYFGQEGTTWVLLLCGGEKSTQTNDIETAHGYWKDYKARRTPKPAVQGVRAPAKRKRNRRLH